MLHLSADSIVYKRILQWQYLNDDKPEYATTEYNDSSWDVVNAMLPRVKGSAVKFDSVGWFRLHVDVDSDLVSEPIWVNIEQQGASEFYVDGQLVKESGKIAGQDKSVYYSSKDDPFLITFNEAGRHLLAIRYANYHSDELIGNNNDIGVEVLFKSVDLGFDGSRSRSNISIISTAFIIFFTAMFMVHLFLFLYYREERSNLYFSLYCLALSVCFLMSLLTVQLSDPWAVLRVRHWLFVPYGLLGFSLSGLSNHLFSKSKKRPLVFGAVAVIAIAISCFTDNEISFMLVMLMIVAAMLESMILTVRAIRRGVKGAKIIGIGILFFCLFFFGLIISAFILKDLSITGETIFEDVIIILLILAILSIPLSMSIYLAWKFSYINKDLKRQLSQVSELSEKTLQQEQEKKKMLESEKERLELQVEERTKEITEEKRKSDELLLNILPEEIADELKERGTSDAKYFDHVTVMFTDFVDFTKAGEKFSPQELVNELDTCFKAFDRIVSKYHIEKIKTIGDAYLCVSGLPSADEEHAVKTVQAAVDILAYMKQRQQDYPERTFNIRIGIHSGAVVAGIVGVKKFAYDIWGDTVNTAARMESSSTPNKINISEATYELVQEHFVCTGRGEIAAKNKGEMSMYFVEGRK